MFELVRDRRVAPLLISTARWHPPINGSPPGSPPRRASRSQAKEVHKSKGNDAGIPASKKIGKEDGGSAVILMIRRRSCWASLWRPSLGRTAESGGFIG
jgi:hypothetical protein